MNNPMDHQSIPPIDQRTIAIMPDTLEEWYGIKIEFLWRDALDEEAVRELCGNPATFQNILTVIQQSAAWKHFYNEEHSVRCERGYDREYRTVRIPRFPRGDDDSTWYNVHATGGSLILHTR